MKASILLERAARAVADTQLPDHADSVVAMLALSIIAMTITSPGDEAERLAQIARMARGML